MRKKTLISACLLLVLTLILPLVNSQDSILPDVDLATIDPLCAPTFKNDVKISKPVTRVVVKTNVELTPEVMDILRSYAININCVLEGSNAVAMSMRTAKIKELTELDIVDWVERDCERYPLDNFKMGLGTWNLDMVNVAQSAFQFGNREVSYDGEGVYVAVLDTGLVKHWRDYFPEDRIATEYAAAFLSASWEQGPIETRQHPADVWQRDTNSHGTHVTSTILGYWMKPFGFPVAGIAPLAKVIPVKVLHNAGFGWSSAIAKGIYYIADLKEMIGAPIVISMSLGGPVGSQMERMAIQYAISKGVPVVAAAGNSGMAGMDYPGAWPETISVGACGWSEEWEPSWWYNIDVSEPTDPSEVYITDFSGRQLADQDLDIVAPGSWVVGPFMPYGVAHPSGNGQPGEYYYLGGTSMATPHVSGIIALMLQKNPALPATSIEGILETTAIDLFVAGHDTDSGWGLVQADAALGP